MTGRAAGQRPGTTTPGVPYVTLAPEEAVAAMEAAAWTEPPGDETYRNAVDALNRMAGERPGPFTAEEIRAVISGHVPEPRRIIHAVTMFGADWDLAAAVAFAREPGAVCWWAWDLFGHDLRVRADGRKVAFDARAPEPLRGQLKDARLRRLAERARERADSKSGDGR